MTDMGTEVGTDTNIIKHTFFLLSWGLGEDIFKKYLRKHTQGNSSYRGSSSLLRILAVSIFANAHQFMGERWVLISANIRTKTCGFQNPLFSALQ